MKKIIIPTLIGLVVYFALYIAVRHMNHDNIVKISRNALGALQTNNIETVAIRLPATGFWRHCKQAEYGLFYPIGKLDKVVTGRLYGIQIENGEFFGVPDPASKYTSVFKE